MWENFIEEKVKEIREIVGDGKVIIVFFGGVDSLIVVVLVYRVIGDRLYVVFVNMGFMCKGEFEFVVKIFWDEFGLNFYYVDVSE